MKRQFSACQTPRSMHPSIFNSFPVIRTANAKKIAVFTYRSPHFCFPWRRPCFNSFRVIRCLSQCVSPKIAIFTTFWFPLGTPPGAITQNVVINEKTIQCLPNPSQHAPIYLQVFQLFETQVQKIAVFTYRSPHFCFPWRRPCDYHATCCMDRKTI